ncbi:hypothetical protein ACJX0J_026315, partial [Zea mays]
MMITFASIMREMIGFLRQIKKQREYCICLEISGSLCSFVGSLATSMFLNNEGNHHQIEGPHNITHRTWSTGWTLQMIFQDDSTVPDDERDGMVGKNSLSTDIMEYVFRLFSLGKIKLKQITMQYCFSFLTFIVGL